MAGHSARDERTGAADSQTPRRVSLRARTLALVAIAAAIGIAGFLAGAADRPAADRWVELIKVDGSINPAVANYIDDALATASRGGAAAVVIELDTPGGLLSSAQHIVKSLLG